MIHIEWWRCMTYSTGSKDTLNGTQCKASGQSVTVLLVRHLPVYRCSIELSLHVFIFSTCYDIIIIIINIINKFPLAFFLSCLLYNVECIRIVWYDMHWSVADAQRFFPPSKKIISSLFGCFHNISLYVFVIVGRTAELLTLVISLFLSFCLFNKAIISMWTMVRNNW